MLTKSQIKQHFDGFDLLASRYGGLPSFEGGQLLTLQIDAATHGIDALPRLSTHWQLDASDSRSTAADGDASALQLHFHDVDNLHINGFTRDSAIDNFAISVFYASRFHQSRVRLHWQSGDSEMSFTCATIEVR